MGAGSSSTAFATKATLGIPKPPPAAAPSPSGFNFNTFLAITSVLSGVGQMFTAKSQAGAVQAQGAYQKQAYNTNARFSDIQAEDAIRRGETEAQKHQRDVKKLVGAQRAALAAQGMDLESGSALDIQLDTATQGAEDAMTIRNNAWRESWGYKVQALNYRTEGEMAAIAAKSTSRQTLFTGALGLTQGLGYGAYYAARGK